MSRTGADELWYPPTLDVFLNRWFSNYDDARAARESGGGFPSLTVSTSSCARPRRCARWSGTGRPRLERIGWDGARPRDAEAYRRLSEKRLRAARRGHG